MDNPDPLGLLATAWGRYWPLILIGIVVYVAYATFQVRKNSATPPGAATGAWARPRDIRPLLIKHPLPGRMAVCRYGNKLIAGPPESWAIVFGGTRMGKTRHIVANVVAEHRGPAVVVSAKPDLVAATAAFRPEILIYDPTGIYDGTEPDSPTLPEGARRVGWSPTDGIRAAIDARDLDRARTLAVSMADAMASESSLNAGENAIWAQATADLLGPFLYAVAAAQHQGLPYTMSDVLQWAKTRSCDPALEILAASPEAADLADSLAAYMDDAGGDRIASSAFFSLRQTLAIYNDPNVRNSTDTGVLANFRPEWLLDPAHPGRTIYLVGTPDDQQRLAPLFVGLIRETLRLQYRRGTTKTARNERDTPDSMVAPEAQLLLVADEAANIAPLKDLDVLASTGAGLGVVGLLVYQDLAQLEQRLGAEKAHTVAANCMMRVMVGGMGHPATIRHMRDLLEYQDVRQTSTTQGGDGKGSTTTQHARVQMDANLRTIDRNTAIVIAGPHKPIRATLRPPVDAPAPRSLSHRVAELRGTLTKGKVHA